MKRMLALILALSLMLCACGSKPAETTAPTTVPPTTEATVPTEPAPVDTNPLTGEPLEEVTSNRPTAIMINNLSKAVPQCGISKADIVTGEMAGAQPLLMQAVTELVNSLVNGKCDAIVLDGAVAEKYIASNDQLAACPITLGEAAEPYRVAVKEGDPDQLLTAINAAIKKAVESGDITTWIEEANALSADAAQ